MNRGVIIIGGGAAGLTAALFAAGRGAEVTVLEKQNRVGKKLLSTGNGKCNLSRRELSPEDYHGGHRGFAADVLSRFSVQNTLGFFKDLGIPVTEKDGLYYPMSEQASSVLDALRFAAEEAGVRILVSEGVNALSERDGGFFIRTAGGDHFAERVILCTGGKSAAHTGSDGSGYALAKKLGHRIVGPFPALVPLRCEDLPYAAMAGVRVQAGIRAMDGGRLLAQDCGQVQFNSYGLSGIPVLQISHAASEVLEQRRSVVLELDLLPEMEEEKLLAELTRRRQVFGEREAVLLFLGLLPKKLGEGLIRQCGIPFRKKLGDLDDEHLRLLAGCVKHLRTAASGTAGWEHAQVTAGGVDTAQVSSRDLQSLRVPGLYFAGEILNIDGPCGGYNLQWAWSTGAVAGAGAAGKELP